MKYTETNYANKKEILKFPDHYVAMAVTVKAEGVVANADGKKIVPAGTIVGGDTGSVLASESIPVVKKNTVPLGAGAEGVLFNDVDVTHGDAPGTMLLHAFISADKIPEAPVTEAKTALGNRILFIK